MPDQPAAEKTEQPTSRKIRKSKEQGNVPQSQELSSAASLMALILALALTGSEFMEWAIIQIQKGLSCQTGVFAGNNAFMEFISQAIIDSIIVMLPIMAIVAVASILASFVMSGINFTPAAINLKFNNINPASVIQNMFNTKAIVRLLTSIAKIIFVSLIAWLFLKSKIEVFSALRWAWSTQLLGELGKLLFGLCIRVGLAIFALALIDAFYQKWQYLHNLKMTREEVKQERKDTEGSAETKSRIRRIQIQMSLKRFLQEVPKANVILVNPTHVAVALKYDAKTMDAPILLAKGADHLAQRIIKIARSYGIPIVRRPELARTIYSTVEPGHPIPQSLYVAVAQVLAMIYRLRQKKKAIPVKS
jgi:flagellar biosynthetic protein FlhB